VRSRFRVSNVFLLVLLLSFAPLTLGLGLPRGFDQTGDTATPSAVDASTPTNVPTDTLAPTDTLPPTETGVPTFTPTFALADTFTPTFATTDTLTPFVTETKTPYLLGWTPPPPPQIPSLKGNFSPDQVLVTLKESATYDDIAACLQFIPFSVDSKIPELRVYVLDIPSGEVAEAIGYLRGCDGIKKADPNYIVEMTDVYPNDPGFGYQYGLINIRAPQGWQINRGSAGVTIAIVDTGIEMSHPDLAPKLVAGYDFVNNDSNPNDDNGHGTHVAGIAAASTNNGVGVAGVSWGARLMPVKVLDAFGNGTYSNVAQGIIWATDHGAQVINLSLGGSSPNSVLQNAVDYAYSRGVVLVAATGNSGSNFVLYPAHYPNVIAVAATDATNTRAGFSNYGPEVSLSAPGVTIYSTQYGGYGYRNGTSMAAPFVSGLAALLRGIPGNAVGPDQIAWEMESTALDLGIPGPDQYYGYGLIQMDAAINLIPPKSNTGSGSSPYYPPGGLIITPTFTPTPTWTPTFLSTLTETPTQTPTTTATQTQIGAMTETPEVTALETPARGKPFAISDWYLPCCGIFLILLAVLVVWLSRRKPRHTYHGLAKSRLARL